MLFSPDLWRGRQSNGSWFSACASVLVENMVAVRGRSIVVTALGVVALAALVSAQITFSRDWSGGKRAAAAPLALDRTQFARLCRHFLHEMKTAMAPDTQQPSTKRHRSSDNSLNLYEDE